MVDAHARSAAGGDAREAPADARRTHTDARGIQNSASAFTRETHEALHWCVLHFLNSSSARPSSLRRAPLLLPSLLSSSLMTDAHRQSGLAHAAGTVEYQAIILATAVGSSLFPLTSDDVPEGDVSSGESVGRSVLPVANRPILFYQLDMIHKAGFPSTIVVTRDTMRKTVSRVIDEWRAVRGASTSAESAVSGATPPLLEVELVALDRYLGSADALRRLASRIHTDFFVLGGDLVSNLPFQNLADLARAQDAGLVMAVTEEADSASLDAKERKKLEAEAAAAGVDAQYFGLDAKTSRLLLFKTQADVEEKLEVSKRLLAAHPRFTLHTRIKDAHLYLFSRWVLDFIATKTSIVSIQSELIPCLVSGQFKKKYAAWRAYGKNSAQVVAMRMSHASRKENEVVAAAIANGANINSQPTLVRADSMLSSTNTLSSLASQGSVADMSSLADGSSSSGGDNFQESFRLFVYHASANTFCARANTLSNYKNLNHELCSDHEYAYMPWPAIASDNYAERIQKQYASSVTIGRETVVGEGTTFTGDSVTIKRSCVGRACNIAARVKLHGCIIMDNVTIEEGSESRTTSWRWLMDCGAVLCSISFFPRLLLVAPLPVLASLPLPHSSSSCSLTDCLISSGAVIGANSVLKDCKIGSKFTVPAGSTSSAHEQWGQRTHRDGTTCRSTHCCTRSLVCDDVSACSRGQERNPVQRRRVIDASPSVAASHVSGAHTRVDHTIHAVQCNYIITGVDCDRTGKEGHMHVCLYLIPLIFMISCACRLSGSFLSGDSPPGPDFRGRS